MSTSRPLADLCHNFYFANIRCWRKTGIRHDIDVCRVAAGEIEQNGKNPSTSDRNRNRVACLGSDVCNPLC